MSIEGPKITISYEAGEDLSAYQFKYVKLSSGKLVKTAAATDKVLGVLQNAPVAGEAGAVSLPGSVTKVRAGAGGLAEGAWVALEHVGPTDTGKGKTAAGTTDGELILGLTIQAAAAEDDLATIFQTLFTLGVAGAA